MKTDDIKNMDNTKVVNESVSKAIIFIIASLSNKNSASPHSVS